jgi:tRNA A58 N-methylase Trm61
MRSNRLILSVLMVGLAAGLLMIGSGVGTMSLAMAGTPVGELKGMSLHAAEAVLASKGFQPEVLPDTDNQLNPLRYYERARSDDSATLSCLRNVDVVELQVNPDTQVVLGYSSRIQRTTCVVR